MKRKWKWATPLCAGGTGSKHYGFTPQVELFTSTFAHTGTTIINRHTKETIHPVFAKYQKKAYNVMILVWTKQNNCEQDLLLIHQSYRYLQLQKKNSFPPKTSIFWKLGIIVLQIWNRLELIKIQIVIESSMMSGESVVSPSLHWLVMWSIRCLVLRFKMKTSFESLGVHSINWGMPDLPGRNLLCQREGMHGW